LDLVAIRFPKSFNVQAWIVVGILRVKTLWRFEMSAYQTQNGIRVFTFVAIVAWALSTNLAQVDQSSVNADENPGSAKLASHEPENSKQTISFQLRDWKAMHFHTPEDAQKHLETVEQLGCVAKQSQHGGHIDVRYHCQEWKSISVEKAETAQQWQAWLEWAGFDVFRMQRDPSFSQGSEGVEFRLADWKTIHGNGSPEQNQFTETLKKIGCDVRITEHNGHSDIRFRAPIWCEIRIADPAAANQWQEWFKAQGFETRLVSKQ
jgi:hypothetical protein